MRDRLTRTWHGIGDWFAWLGHWLDHQLRPPVGRRRELWDTSLFLFGISLVGYVITTPSPAVTDALAAPLRFVTETELGWFVAIAALVGVCFSYGPQHWLDVGYAAPRIAAWLMMLNFLSGILLVTLDTWTPMQVNGLELAGPQVESVLRAGFIYALIFGWAARRLGRDNRAWWER